MRCAFLIGARGFEPPTSCSRSRRATRLRYAPSLRGTLYVLDEAVSSTTSVTTASSPGRDAP